MKNMIAAALCTTLAACVSPSMYSWGPYEQGLYQSYKDPTQIEALRTSLESHITSIEAAKQKVAPGLYAELGTCYLQRGDTEKAKFYYSKEKEAWPESQGLMTVMLQNIERHEKDKIEAAK